ncbi:sulfatase family protein [Spirillospora sp. CA-294931]|uniref:sulfatase family protein n=1 Tax=Spirillospora sp. CA-294931 TaxID=3240042 RepID=UPI003D8BC455
MDLHGSKTGASLLVVVLAAAGLAAVGGGAVLGRAADRGRRPSVVMIMTDDQWFGSLRAMPRTRALIGDAGTRFDRYHASMPLCCPSRSTYLSGRFAHNNGVRHNMAPLGGYDRLDERNTLPVWLRKAGYTTSHIGKYPNGYGKKNPRHVPPGWDEWRGSVDPTTYRMWGYRLNENGRLTTYGHPDVEDPALYQTDVYRDKAIDFITRRSREGRPFFLDVAFLAPHSEGRRRRGEPKPEVRKAPRPAPRHRGAFAREPLPRPPSFDEADVSDKPPFLRARPRLDRRTVDAITASYRGRLASLLAVDEAVEKIVAALRANGRLADTYLLFTSDNGFLFGQHRIPSGKFVAYEASSHVPMLMRGPGIPPGGVSRELVGNADLAPTIAAIASARPTHALDGRSLLPFARDPRRRTARPILHEAAEGAGTASRAAPDDVSAGRQAAQGDLDQDGPSHPVRGNGASAGYEAIRTERYLFVRYSRGGAELYDLRADPHELDSRHDDPRYARVRRYLEDRLDELQRCAGDACGHEVGEP